MFDYYHTSSPPGFCSVASWLKEIMSAHRSSRASMLFPNKFKYALLVTISSVQENVCITSVHVGAP
jgi:hypothetical protein